jgi:hypothetical protein
VRWASAHLSQVKGPFGALFLSKGQKSQQYGAELRVQAKVVGETLPRCYAFAQALSQPTNPPGLLHQQQADCQRVPKSTGHVSPVPVPRIWYTGEPALRLGTSVCLLGPIEVYFASEIRF